MDDKSLPPAVVKGDVMRGGVTGVGEITVEVI
jgi:hypothetical protein